MKGRNFAYAVGGILIGIGAFGILANAADTHPRGWAIWFGGAAVFHDAVLVPVVLLAGALTTRIPAPYRRIVVAALMVAGCVTVVALPFVLGYGRHPGNPSLLPLPYGRNLLAVLTLIGVVAAARAVILRRRRRGHSG